MLVWEETSELQREILCQLIMRDQLANTSSVQSIADRNPDYSN
jgi:hypothetical protein